MTNKLSNLREFLSFSRSGEGGAKRRMWVRDGSRMDRAVGGAALSANRSNPTSGPSDHLLPMGEGRKIVASLIVGCTVFATTTFAATPLTDDWAKLNEPMEPFHVIGPIYDVGMKGLDVYFIRTQNGAVLIDGGFEQSADQIEANIAKLGFSIKDVKFIINEHAHIDHAGGIDKLRRDSKGAVIANAADVPALNLGHVDYGPSAGAQYPPVYVDVQVGDHDSFTVGSLTFFAHATPGHTKGCTAWTMRFWENFHEHTAIFTCSITVAGNPIAHNPPTYPRMTADYRKSFATLRGVYADVVLAPHPGIWNRDEKLARAAKEGDGAFVDKTELRRLVDDAEKDFDDQLAKQKAQGQ